MRIGILVNVFASVRSKAGTGPISHGVGLYTLELISALIEQDTESEFVLIGEKPVHLPTRLQGNPRVTQVSMPLDIKGFPRTGIWREYAATRARIDLLHEPEPSAGILRLARYPLVLTVHDLAPMIFPRMFRRTHGWTFRRLVPRNVSRADAIIADSEHTRRDLERLVHSAAGKTRVVHLAGQSLSADTEVQGAVKPEHPYILSVATVEPRKNHIALLDAYQILRERGTDVRLVLTGRAGWANSNVYRHPALEVYGDQIVFTGVVSCAELAGLYRNAQVFVYPSLYEGFGLPPLEALAAGVPTIVGRNSCFPEVLGDAAHYVSPHPTGAEIADAVTVLMNDAGLRSDLCSRGRQRAGEFSWQKTAVATLEVYREVLRSSTRC